MAKRIVMIPPFEALTGNLSGRKELQYAENNNPAYEAPNGAQGARNYVARYVGAKRADGKTYYSVRTKQTSVLNNKTRTAMAITGSIAAIKSALMRSHAADWVKIQSSYEYLKERGQLPESVTTFNKYVDYNLRDMLRYKREQWSFTQASIAFSVANPYKLDNTSALIISQAIWNKFAAMLAFTALSAQAETRIAEFSIDGSKFINPKYSADFGTSKGAMANLYCSNLVAQWGQITMASAAADSNVLYKGAQVYTELGDEVNGETKPLDSKFTTIAPEA